MHLWIFKNRQAHSLVELYNESVERASGKGWADREMEGNRISGEFPTPVDRFIGTSQRYACNFSV